MVLNACMFSVSVSTILEVRWEYAPWSMFNVVVVLLVLVLLSVKRQSSARVDGVVATSKEREVSSSIFKYRTSVFPL